MSEFEGKTISVISTEDIRYVGVLQSVDADRGTLSLIQVRILGTEDRIHDPSEIQLPQKTVYPSLHLDGANVKALEILDCDVQDVVPVPVPQQQPPVQQVQQSVQPLQQQQQQQQQQQEAAVPASDFTFDNAKLESARTEANTEQDAPAYDAKKSFFDNLSSVDDERYSWKNERDMNMDTFGESGNGNRRQFRGRGKGRGGNRGGNGNRGGRGGNRGGNSGRKEQQPEWAF